METLNPLRATAMGAWRRTNCTCCESFGRYNRDWDFPCVDCIDTEQMHMAFKKKGTGTAEGRQENVRENNRIVAELKADEAERKLRRQELKERDLKIDADAWRVRGRT